MIDQRYYTPEEVAELLKVDVSTVYRYMGKAPGEPGFLPSIRPAGTKIRRVAAAALDEFLNGRTAEPSVEAPVVHLAGRK